MNRAARPVCDRPARHGLAGRHGGAAGPFWNRRDGLSKASHDLLMQWMIDTRRAPADQVRRSGRLGGSAQDRHDARHRQRRVHRHFARREGPRHLVIFSKVASREKRRTTSPALRNILYNLLGSR
jgi:hypothetical protein